MGEEAARGEQSEPGAGSQSLTGDGRRTPGGEIFVPSHVGDVLRAHVSLRSPLALRWFTPNLRRARGERL